MVKPSKVVDGRGVFTEEFIPKGAVVWQFREKDHICWRTEEEFDAWAKNKTETEIDDCLMHLYCEKGVAILITDGTQYINHSLQPNLVADNERMCSIAARDIQPGEEILENYGEYETLDFIEQWAKKYNIVTCSKLPEHLEKFGTI